MSLLRRPLRATALAGLAAASIVAACGGDDGSPTPAAGGAAGGPDTVLVARGEEVTRSRGCLACHSTGPERGNGPGWGGLYGSEVELADGTTVIADDAFLRRSIQDPGADIVDGFAPIMPSYDLSDAELDAVLAYLESLAPPAG